MKGMTMQAGWRTMLVGGSALLLAAGLGGCSNENVDNAPIENSAFDEEAAPPAEVDNDDAVNFEAAPPVVENLTAAAPPVEELPPPPPIEPDQQVLDDASATGLTSPSTRGEPTPEATTTEDTPSGTEQL